MKAFVIKNKEGKYFDKECICFCRPDYVCCEHIYYTIEHAKYHIDYYGLKDCEVVEITIVEGDLEQQLAEKETKINELSDEHLELFGDMKTYKNLWLAEQRKNKEIRKQVCDEIREKLQMNENNTCENTAFGVYYDYLKEILDEIEKGE